MKSDLNMPLLNYTNALMVALGYRDKMTMLHSERVFGLTIELAKVCGLSSKSIEVLKAAACFHDIGKIGVPDHILLKPSKLNDAEWIIMKQHSVMGEKIMESTNMELFSKAAKIIRHHHEYFDGGGYPDKITANKIPLGSRIISIADSYDAMAVTRSYHKARTHTQIMNVMHQETGKKHDPELMKLFTKAIETSLYKTQNI